MKKLTQALFLALVVAAPVAISAPQVKASPLTDNQQVSATASNPELAANTADAKAMRRKRRKRTTTTPRKGLEKVSTQATATQEQLTSDSSDTKAMKKRTRRVRRTPRKV